LAVAVAVIVAVVIVVDVTIVVVPAVVAPKVVALVINSSTTISFICANSSCTSINSIRKGTRSYSTTTCSTL